MANRSSLPKRLHYQEFARKYFGTTKRFHHFALEALRLTFKPANWGRSVFVFLSGAAFFVNMHKSNELVAGSMLRDVLSLSFTFATASIALVVAGFAIFAATATTDVGARIGAMIREGRSETYDLALHFFEPLVPMMTIVVLQLSASLVFFRGSFLAVLLWNLTHSSRLIYGLAGGGVGMLLAWSVVGVLSLTSNVMKSYLLMTGKKIQIDEPELMGEWKFIENPTLATTPTQQTTAPGGRSKELGRAAPDDDDGPDDDDVGTNHQKGLKKMGH